MASRKLALLSNITIDPVAAKLRRNFGIYTPSGYNAWIPDLLNSSSELYTDDLDTVFILLDGTECRSWIDESDACERLELWKQAISFYVSRVSDTPIFISNIDFRANRIAAMSQISFSARLEKDWTDFISDAIAGSENVFLYDIKSTITDIGRNAFYSDKMWYLGNMPYSRDGISQIVADINLLIKRYYEPAKKIIVLDLDNTLWGGVLGEDGIEGIELSDHKEGQRYYDFQRQLSQMKNAGVLLALNSKNNEEDAKRVFDEHPYSLLKWDDFVSKKVNWNNKAANIKEMQQELNLTEGSFVFVDDNPVEREIVKGECPEVTVLDFPNDTTELSKFAEHFYREYFMQARVLLEDVRKTQMYLADGKRREVQANALDINEYIEKLEIEVDIHPMTTDEILRTVQLCGKTNQFNLTTIRYSEKEIIEMCNADDTHIFTVHTKDKYGDNGLVSVLVLKISGEQATIESFLMSCRVMGRNLEHVIANAVLGFCKNHGVKSVIGKYTMTAKNTPVKDLYTRLGFDTVESTENTAIYKIDSEHFESKQSDAFKRISFSDN